MTQYLVEICCYINNNSIVTLSKSILLCRSIAGWLFGILCEEVACTLWYEVFAEMHGIVRQAVVDGAVKRRAAGISENEQRRCWLASLVINAGALVNVHIIYEILISAVRSINGIICARRESDCWWHDGESDIKTPQRFARNAAATTRCLVAASTRPVEGIPVGDGMALVVRGNNAAFLLKMISLNMFRYNQIFWQYFILLRW